MEKANRGKLTHIPKLFTESRQRNHIDAGSKKDIVDLKVQKREKVFQVSDFSYIGIKK